MPATTTETTFVGSGSWRTYWLTFLFLRQSIFIENIKLIKMSKEKIRTLFEDIFGKIEEDIGYSLTVRKVRSGFLAFKFYQRNSWVDDELERKILFHNDGRIFEDNKQIGSFE